MKLPGWLRVLYGGCADGVLDARSSEDRNTLHLLAYYTTNPDVGDMVTVWEHRSVHLRSGWVDAVRYAREPEDAEEAEREAHKAAFWAWVSRQCGAPLLPFGPPSVTFALCDPNRSDTQKPTVPPLRDGIRIYHNERIRDGLVEVVRDGQVLARHDQAGATSLGGQHRSYLWVGDGPQPGQVTVVAGALRPSVLVLDLESGMRLLHTRV